MQIWAVLGTKIVIRVVGVISLLMRTRSILLCTQNGHSTVRIAKIYGHIVSAFIRHLKTQLTSLLRIVNRVSDVFNLRKYMHFEHRIARAEWVDKDGKWKVTVERRQSDGNWEEFEDYCDVFLYATGVLNKTKWPDIKGLEKFQGRVCNSRPFDPTLNSELIYRYFIVPNGRMTTQKNSGGKTEWL